MTAFAALTAATIAACTTTEPSQAQTAGPDQGALDCARSIASAPPGSSVLTATCREAPMALTVLSAAQEKYSSLDNLVTDLSAKLDSANTTIEELTQEIEDNAARTSQARADLLEANDEVSSQTANRIRTNLETQAILEDSSVDMAAMTVGTVQTRIDHATELEETWMTRYTDLEERYDTLRELLSAETSELLTAQILLDQERADFDRIVTNAILNGTREERDRLSELQTQAQELYSAAQASITQSLADMAHVKALLDAPPAPPSQATIRNLNSRSCQSAWTSLRLLTLSHAPTPESLNSAWTRLKSACTAP